MKIGLGVTNCNDCPLVEIFKLSNKPQFWRTIRAPYENSLYGCNEEFKGTPIWCPLLKDNNQNNLNYETNIGRNYSRFY